MGLTASDTIGNIMDSSSWDDTVVNGSENIAAIATHAMDNQFNADEAQKNRDFQTYSAQQQQDYNERNLGIQQRYNLAMQKDAQAFSKQMQDEQNEYNSIGSQIERAKEAGVNPNTAIGNSTPSGSGVSPSASSVGLPSSSMPTGSQATAGSAPHLTSSAEQLGTILDGVSKLGNTVKDGLMSIPQAKNLASSSSKNIAEVDNLKAKTDYQKIVNSFSPSLLDSEIRKNLSSSSKDDTTISHLAILNDKLKLDMKNSFMQAYCDYYRTVSCSDAQIQSVMADIGKHYSQLDRHASTAFAQLGNLTEIKAYELGGQINKVAESTYRDLNSRTRNYEHGENSNIGGNAGISAGNGVVGGSVGVEGGSSESTTNGVSTSNEAVNGSRELNEELGAKLKNSELYKDGLKYSIAQKVYEASYEKNRELAMAAYEYLKGIKERLSMPYYIDLLKNGYNQISTEDIQSR